MSIGRESTQHARPQATSHASVPHDRLVEKSCVLREGHGLLIPVGADLRTGLPGHERLDEAVAAAYGWEWPLTDEHILERLLALNLERAAAEEATASAGVGLDDAAAD